MIIWFIIQYIFVYNEVKFYASMQRCFNVDLKWNKTTKFNINLTFLTLKNQSAFCLHLNGVKGARYTLFQPRNFNSYYWYFNFKSTTFLWSKETWFSMANPKRFLNKLKKSVYSNIEISMQFCFKWEDFFL